MDRSQKIIRTSIIGIVANVLLAAFKAAVGILASSVAIVMDAVNNLSDALSSVITIIGTKLSERPADREHPFGFGRVEYFSAITLQLLSLAFYILSQNQFHHNSHHDDDECHGSIFRLGRIKYLFYRLYQ